MVEVPELCFISSTMCGLFPTPAFASRPTSSQSPGHEASTSHEMMDEGKDS